MPVRIDLGLPRIALDIRNRYELFSQEARDLIGTDLNPQEVDDNPDLLLQAVDAYFLLSEAYKVRMLGHVEGGDEHWTQPSKKAALTTIAIMLMRPIQPLHPLKPTNDRTTLVANQIFALALASSLLGRDFTYVGFREASRLYRLLGHIGSVRLPVRALTRFRRDRRRNNRGLVYHIDIVQDIVLIDSLILLYEAPLRP